VERGRRAPPLSRLTEAPERPGQPEDVEVAVD